MTFKRINEITMELPSKRLFLNYVRRFRTVEDHGHLNDHFGILKRQSVEIARSLFNMADADYEFGRLENRVREILDAFQFNITSLAAADAAENKERDDKINDRKIARAEQN